MWSTLLATFSVWLHVEDQLLLMPLAYKINSLVQATIMLKANNVVNISMFTYREIPDIGSDGSPQQSKMHKGRNVFFEKLSKCSKALQQPKLELSLDDKQRNEKVCT